MRNLTRDEARARAALLQVASYDVDLVLSEDEHFASVSEVRFSCREPGASTFLELDGELLALERGGAAVEPVVEGNRIVLDDLAAEEVVRVTARCSTTRSGEGLHRSVDPADGEVYLYAQAFLDDAQRIFACFDQPDLKARVRLSVTAPEQWRVLANTRAERVGGRHVFAPTERISTYLVTLAAGPYEGEQQVHDGIELGVWCRRSLRPYLEPEELLGITRRCLDAQQEVFGRRYPFGDSYHQVFVPDFNAGAMENPGMVTFADEAFVFRSRTTQGRRRLRAQVIAHEMAHMWFGDLVTMRWWDDLWLNESFAEMLGVWTVERALPEYPGGRADFCLGRKAWGYRADQLPTTHPVAGDVADNRSALLNFDGISYAKGASALRQLSAWLGEDVFFAGVRLYLRQHAWGNTGLEDLLAALEQASGRDLQAWAQVWLRTSGVSLLRLQDGALLQEGDPLRPHHLGVGTYDDADGVLRLRERVEVDLEGARIPVPELAPADLVLPNDGDLTFAKVRLDPRSLATVRSGLARLPDPLARALVWGALWDAARDAELPAADLVATVLGNVSAESDPDVVETLLGQARRAAGLWSPEPDALLRQLARSGERAARDSEPGSDLQLVHVQAAAAAALDPGPLRALLDGVDLPAGLVVDHDLRWHLLVRLAALGAAGEDDVAAELAGDRTASGEQHAAQAGAARRDPQAKAAAWDELLGDGELSNSRARALGSGFWQLGQDALLRPYVDRYAAEVAGLWERRSPALATSIARLLFPATLVEQSVLDATGALLDGDLPAGLRRVLLEERDELSRALQARRA